MHIASSLKQCIALNSTDKKYALGGKAFTNCYTLHALPSPSFTANLGGFYDIYCRNFSLNSAEIGESACSDQKTLEEVYMPECSIIRKYSSSECYVLGKVFAQKVELALTSAFECCYCLVDVYMPLLKEIYASYRSSDGAFRFCKSFERISLPKFVHTITCDNFKFCISLSEVDFPEVANLYRGCFFIVFH